MLRRLWQINFFFYAGCAGAPWWALFLYVGLCLYPINAEPERKKQ